METEFKKAINCIISKDDETAKKIIREVISQHPKYKEYKKSLSEYGLSLEKIEVPEKVYEQIEEAISGYDKAAKLKILDRAYKQIATVEK